MRLIDVHSLELEEVPDDSGMVYAVLSHTWRQGSEGGEIKLQDFQRGLDADESTGRSILHGHAGFQKVLTFCDTAANLDIHKAWADNVCIDQTNPAELSRSINSMFRWYKQSTKCLVYLSDVSITGDDGWHAQFRASRWFKRGWTLQELIAPPTVIFHDRDWKLLGKREELSLIISDITSIPANVLTGDAGALGAACVAQKMAWASMRRTTAPEDIAYCLLGLFDVFMPLIYGEGAERAFLRLQKEILETTEDESIFAWCETPSPNKGGSLPQFSGLLARSPAAFKSGADVRLPRSRQRVGQKKLSMSPGGLEVELLVAPSPLGRSLHRAQLNCLRDTRGAQAEFISVILLHLTEARFCRVKLDQLLFSPASEGGNGQFQTLFVRHLHSWPEVTPVCSFGPSQSLTMEDISDNLRNNTHNCALRPISALISHGTTRIMPTLDAGFVFLEISQDTEATPTIVSEPMLDVSRVEAVPEALVTFALQVRPQPLATNRFAAVTVHHFDVVFGYNCLANAAGTRKQRLSPWARIGKQRSRPAGQSRPSQVAGFSVHSCQDMQPVLLADDKETYDIPLEAYNTLRGFGESVPIFLIGRLRVEIEDTATWKGVFHAVLIGPGNDDLVETRTVL
jgi:hypothetical protein